MGRWTRHRALSLTIGVLIGGGAVLSATLIALREVGSTPADNPPSGHYILLPDEPSRTDDRGVMILEATTNLPQGTLVDIGVGGPDIEGASGGIPVEGGLIEIRVAMNSCRKVDGDLQAPAIGVVVIAAPFSAIGHSGPRRGRPSPDPPRQPADVRAILGDRFENLQGEQVQTDERGSFLRHQDLWFPAGDLYAPPDRYRGWRSSADPSPASTGRRRAGPPMVSGRVLRPPHR